MASRSATVSRTSDTRRGASLAPKSACRRACPGFGSWRTGGWPENGGWTGAHGPAIVPRVGPLRARIGGACGTQGRCASGTQVRDNHGGSGAGPGHVGTPGSAYRPATRGHGPRWPPARARPAAQRWDGRGGGLPPAGRRRFRDLGCRVGGSGSRRRASDPRRASPALSARLVARGVTSADVATQIATWHQAHPRAAVPQSDVRWTDTAATSFPGPRAPRRGQAVHPLSVWLPAGGPSPGG